MLFRSLPWVIGRSIFSCIFSRLFGAVVTEYSFSRIPCSVEGRVKTDARLSVVMECSKIGLMRIFGFQKDLKASRTMVMFVVLPDGSIAELSVVWSYFRSRCGVSSRVACSPVPMQSVALLSELATCRFP